MSCVCFIKVTREMALDYAVDRRGTTAKILNHVERVRPSSFAYSQALPEPSFLPSHLKRIFLCLLRSFLPCHSSAMFSLSALVLCSFRARCNSSSHFSFTLCLRMCVTSSFFLGLSLSSVFCRFFSISSPAAFARVVWAPFRLSLSHLHFSCLSSPYLS